MKIEEIADKSECWFRYFTRAHISGDEFRAALADFYVDQGCFGLEEASHEAGNTAVHQGYMRIEEDPTGHFPETFHACDAAHPEAFPVTMTELL